MPVSFASRFSVIELTGEQRELELLGRALPYQQVSFGGDTTHKLQFYPGNPEGTLQVLSSTLLPTKIQGMWKNRFVADQVEAVGFPALAPGEVVTAERLVQAFESIRRSGQRLRVQWYSVVRDGILASFTPTWIRLQDVQWEAEFVWFGENVSGTRASEPGVITSRSDMRRVMDSSDQALRSRRPASVQADYSAQLRAVVRQERVQIAQVFAAINQILLAAPSGTTPSDPVNALASAAVSIASYSAQAQRQGADVPYLAAIQSDSVTDVLGAEAWRRLIAATQRDLAATALRTAEEQRDARRSSVGQTVVMPGETTLRGLSLRYYGTSDSWQLIADANGLVDSRVPAGTRVYVPPPPSR
jgi:hypothetical protein